MQGMLASPEGILNAQLCCTDAHVPAVALQD